MCKPPAKRARHTGGWVSLLFYIFIYFKISIDMMGIRVLYFLNLQKQRKVCRIYFFHLTSYVCFCFVDDVRSSTFNNHFVAALSLHSERCLFPQSSTLYQIL